jgi:hypothetical protein
MASPNELSGALEAVDRILNVGGRAEDVLRAVVAALHERAAYPGVAIRSAHGESAVAGQMPDNPGASVFPVDYQGVHVADLLVAGPLAEEDERVLRRVAVLVSAHCL